MAYAVQNFGPCLVKVGVGSQGALVDLGYTRAGADEIEEAFMINVPGDEYGGDEGPPIEIQYLGGLCRIRLELTKFDRAVLDKIRSRARLGAGGVPLTSGTLLFSGNHYMRLVLATPLEPREYPITVPRAPIEMPRGTRFSMAVCEFECHKDPASGKLWKSYEA